MTKARLNLDAARSEAAAQAAAAAELCESPEVAEAYAALQRELRERLLAYKGRSDNQLIGAIEAMRTGLLRSEAGRLRLVRPDELP